MPPKPSRTYPNLDAYLRDTHTTLDAFAAAMGIAPSYVSMLRRNEREPSLSLALRIAERARVPLESLVKASEAA